MISVPHALLDRPEQQTKAGLPRILELILALLALALLSPVLLICSGLVALSSKGPVLFTQERIGRDGRPFRMIKFRTMSERGGLGPKVTAGGDPRITRVGGWLRRSKMDELPELWNIVRGDMSFVGPRPEVEDFVDVDDPRWRAVLAARPGLTDPVTLELRDEEALLARVANEDRVSFYREHLLPYKLSRQSEYLLDRSALSDLSVLWRTGWAIVHPASARPPSLEQIRAATTAGEA